MNDEIKTETKTMKNKNLIAAALMISGLAFQACSSGAKQEDNTGAATTMSADTALDTIGDAATKKEITDVSLTPNGILSLIKNNTYKNRIVIETAT